LTPLTVDVVSSDTPTPKLGARADETAVSWTRSESSCLRESFLILSHAALGSRFFMSYHIGFESSNGILESQVSRNRDHVFVECRIGVRRRLRIAAIARRVEALRRLLGHDECQRSWKSTGRASSSM